MNSDPTSSIQDEALMAAYQDGNVRAFEVLFERHRRPLFTFLVHRLGDRALAEDIFQDIFLRIAKKRESFEAGRRFRPWLFTIAHNAIIDNHRRKSVRSAINAEESMDKEHADAHRGPLEHAVQKEVACGISEALAKLPEEQREVFLMRERAGLDFATIATALGCGTSTAKSRMRYALEGLRHLLSGDLDPQANHE